MSRRRGPAPLPFLLLGCISLAACSPSAGLPDPDARRDDAGAGAGGGGNDTDSGSGGQGGGWFDPDDPLPTDPPDADAGEAGTGLQDAMPDVDPDACSDEPYVPGPFKHECRPPTDNECDGLYEDGNYPNGMYGNGFDDDCDGIVDEGCACQAAGTTRTCYLVPPSQVDPSTNAPVGFCAENSKGTITCVQKNELVREWDGYCKGAQQPFAEDVCAPGDFDCDGRDSNNPNLDCSCAPPIVVECPSAPIVTSPYPDPSDLTKKKNNPLDPDPSTPFIINGHDWIVGADPADAQNWKWTVTGGDCDNILPHPTFAIYDGPNANTANRIGTKSNTLGNGQQAGFVVGGAGSTQNQIWPAFALSGDYTVKGEFDLDGEHYECTVKVQARWPGLRAELCWDSVGSTDVDLHFARLQGQSCSDYGWFSTCNKLDCYYSNCKESKNLDWGYATSSDEACKGWGSRRTGSCNNPRLDQDNVTCSTTQTDPLASNFCAPENTNIDNPRPGEMFAIGVHYYGRGTNARPHVNVYCNGERKLAFGYDPTTTPPSMFPVLKNKTSSTTGGDFWSVARVTWLGDDDPEVCKIEPVPSLNPKADQDGSSTYCVDKGPQNSTTGNTRWYFMSPSSSVPTGPIPSPFQTGKWFCWH